MDYGAIYDLLASRYAWLSLDRFQRLTPRMIYFMVSAAHKGIRRELETEAALHGMKLKPADEEFETTELSEAQKAELDRRAQEQLDHFASLRVGAAPLS